LRERLLGRLPLAQLQKFMTSLAEAQRRREVNSEVEPRLVFVSLIGLTLLPLATLGIWRSLPPLKSVTHEELARHAEALLLHGLFAPDPKPTRRR
jgi:hypothetical protein